MHSVHNFPKKPCTSCTKRQRNGNKQDLKKFMERSYFVPSRIGCSSASQLCREWSSIDISEAHDRHHQGDRQKSVLCTAGDEKRLYRGYRCLYRRYRGGLCISRAHGHVNFETWGIIVGWTSTNIQGKFVSRFEQVDMSGEKVEDFQRPNGVREVNSD
jgi:hypothetical protein